MPKPRLSLLPAREIRIDAVEYELPQQGVQKSFLRAPTHAELLTALEAGRELHERFTARGDWFPSSTGRPFPVSRSLANVAALVHLQQRDEAGGPLSSEEAFSDTEALDWCGSSEAFYSAFFAKFVEYQAEEEGSPKNS